VKNAMYKLHNLTGLQFKDQKRSRSNYQRRI